jgi:hypothetical protein
LHFLQNILHQPKQTVCIHNDLRLVKFVIRLNIVLQLHKSAETARNEIRTKPARICRENLPNSRLYSERLDKGISNFLNSKKIANFRFQDFKGQKKKNFDKTKK